MLDLEQTKPAPTEPPDDKAYRTGDEERRGVCSNTQTTRAKELSLDIHQEMPYLESFNRRRTSLDRANFGVNTYAPNWPYTDRLNLSKSLNHVEINALLFYLIPRKTTRCFQAAKTTSKALSNENHWSNYYLPCLEPKEINQQQLFPSSPQTILKAYLLHLDVPRSHQFAPKLSRLKHITTCLIWSDSTINLSNSSFSLIFTISFIYSSI